MRSKFILLAALSALLVSSALVEVIGTKQTTYAIIDDSLESSLLFQLFHGDEKKYELKEMTMVKPSDNRTSKALYYFKQTEILDSSLATVFGYIEGVKARIVKESNSENVILRKYDPTRNPLWRAYISLYDLKEDAQTELLSGASNVGGPIAEKYLESFEKSVILAAGSHCKTSEQNKELVVHDDRYFINLMNLDALSKSGRFKEGVEEMCGSDNVHRDDAQMLKDLFYEFYKGMKYWRAFFQDHHSSADAIMKLNSLELDLLKMRSRILSLIRSRVGYNVFPTTEAKAIAFGPEVVNVGDEFELQIYPVSVIPSEFVSIEHNGDELPMYGNRGILKARAKDNFMDFNGTVKVRDKSGITRELQWSKSVAVMKPSGSIDLPEMNVLYRDYENRVIPIANGYPGSDLSVAGGSVTKNNGIYLVTPANGRTCRMTVVGKTPDGRSVALKSVEYRIMELPQADMYLGKSISGSQFKQESWMLDPRTPHSSPVIADYEVVSWKTTINGKNFEGKGNDVSTLKEAVGSMGSGDLLAIECEIRFTKSKKVFRRVYGWRV